MNAEPKEKVSYIPEFLIAAGYIVFFCLALTLCYAFYFLTYLQPLSAPVVNTFATKLPPATPIAHFLLTDHKDAITIFEDDFSDNSHSWEGINDALSEQITLGKLVVESRKRNYSAIAQCGRCTSLNEPFYIQADFSTKDSTDSSFGLAINFDHIHSTYYVFEINTEAQKYYFYHLTSNGWSLVAAGENQHIKSFPASNTLGIYANQDYVEFYVNGEIIDSYTQSGYSFQKGYFGFFVDTSDFKLIVDNLIIKEAKE